MRTRFFSLLVVATVVGCTDTPFTPIGGSIPVEEPEDGSRTVTGFVVSENELLSNEDGSTIPLMGPHTRMLAELVGAEVRIFGTSDEFEDNLWVIEFRVLAVDGLPALDGKLDYGEEGFAIVSPEGALSPLAELPDDLMGQIGRRVWMTLREGTWVRYGVIEE
jgi:hypothetical protein